MPGRGASTMRVDLAVARSDIIVWAAIVTV